MRRRWRSSVPALWLDLVEDDTGRPSEGAYLLPRKIIRPHKCPLVRKQASKTEPATDPDIASQAKSHRESGFRIGSREIDNRSGGLERGGGVSDAEEGMNKRRDAGPVAHLELRARHKVEQPWIDGSKLRRGRGRKGNGELVRTKMRRKVTHDSQVSGYIADDCRLEPFSFFVEIQVAHRADIGELEAMVIGLHGCKAHEHLESRV